MILASRAAHHPSHPAHRLPAAVDCLPDPAGRPPATVDHLPVGVDRPPETMDRLPARVDRPLAGVDCLPATVDRLPDPLQGLPEAAVDAPAERLPPPPGFPRRLRIFPAAYRFFPLPIGFSRCL